VRATVGGEIETIHRARDIQVAVGIESAHKAAGVCLKITLNGELGRKRAILLFRGRMACETFAATRGRSDTSSCRAFALYAFCRWRLLVRVSTTAPVGIAQDGLALN